MIKRIYSGEDFYALPEKGTEAQKIRALLMSYGTGYDFCRFFRQGSSILAVLDGSAVLCAGEDCDYCELVEFLSINGFIDLFCGESSAKPLAQTGGFSIECINLMRYCGTPTHAALDLNPPLSEVWDIVGQCFEIEYEPWYLDMSHRIRHGVTRCAVMDGSALCIQHNINGEALLSQIATMPGLRGEGRASRLISAVCGSLCGSEIYLLCGDGLVTFYEKVGFAFVENKYVLTR